MPGTDRVEIRTLKVGRFCVVDDEAYKILSISKSKPGTVSYTHLRAHET